MAGVRKLSSGNYQGWYKGVKEGKVQRIFFTGTSSKIETRDMAQSFEQEHKKILLGYREAPAIPQRHKDTAYLQIVAEYIAWGEAQGGRKGYPWSKGHANRMHAMLERYWPEVLGLDVMGDMYGILSGVEKAVQQMQQKGNCGKTINQNVNALHSFCNWCIERDYLSDNPLKKFKPVKAEPTFQRRAMTLEEIQKVFTIINANPDLFGYWKVLLPVACCTGIRSNAIKQLTIDDLNVKTGQLRLKASSAKNRTESLKPISEGLIDLILEFYQSGEVENLYRTFYSRNDASQQPPENALVYVPSHPARELDKILELAGIEKENAEGRIDFHALRAAYATFIVEAGATLKEAQSALDHSDPRLTSNIYAKTRQENMQKLAQRVSEPIMNLIKCANSVQEGDVDSLKISRNSRFNKELRRSVNGGAAGIE